MVFHQTSGSIAPKASKRPWLSVLLLSLLYALSFIDRNILALLVRPVQTELHLTEVQLGLLMGLGFSVLYFLVGLPLGHFVDRGNRRRLLIAGVTLWSAASIASAFAYSYAQLLALRGGLAIGEAVLMPVAITMIADLFGKERRALPTSLYMAVGAVMGTGSLVVGAGAVALGNVLAPTMGFAAWRLTLAIVGVPGLALAGAIAVLMREPARSNEEGGEIATLSDAFGHFASNAAVYVGVFLGVGAMLILAASLVAWGPSMLISTHGLTAARAGALFGLCAMAGSMAGTLSVPWLLRQIPLAQRARALVNLGILFAVLAPPVVALTISAPRLPMTLLGIAIGFAGLAGTVLLGPLLIQTQTPHRLRGRMMAVHGLLTNMTAMSIGPIIISVFHANHAGNGTLGGAIAATSWLSMILALHCYGLALYATRRTVQVRPKRLIPKIRPPR